MGIIDVIYRKNNTDDLVTENQNKLFDLLDKNKHPYRCYDLDKYNKLSELTGKLKGCEFPPYVFINNYFIGGYKEFKELADMKIVTKILNRDYDDLCLKCHILKNDESEECPFCSNKYLFFATNPEIIDVYKERK